MNKKPLTYQILIKGIVQGVGFRPFVWRLAHEFKLCGEVFNHTKGVTIIIQEKDTQLDRFLERLRTTLPPASRVDQIIVQPILPSKIYRDFTITESVSDWQRNVPIVPDLHLCADCARELFDPHNRRYLYPFINCTNCGPRFSIITDVPYDRSHTTMRRFQMCLACLKEYNDPSDRRFHAQPNACPVCGPQLTLTDGVNTIARTGNREANAAFFTQVAELLQAGNILAIKSLGGYHLACDARDSAAVRLLRSRKYRADKPFAVMFPSLSAVKEYCHLDPQAEQALISVPHPIVLVRKNESQPLADSVAPNNRYLGAMLPYTPLHALLFHFYPYPLVMTSGNISEEPIAFEDEDALSHLKDIADYYMMHDRPIFIRCDDSVVRIFEDRLYPIRLSRGYMPAEILCSQIFTRPILACGAEQKNTIALARERRLLLSQHIGDLKNYATLSAYLKTISHLQKIYDIQPEVLAYDLHPEYLSTKFAREYSGPENCEIVKIGIQHHHAHAVSCMVDNGIEEPVIGIILDGTGYGTDGAIWGGEILRVTLTDFQLLGQFDYVPMPGAQAAIDHPWQMALGYLFKVYGEEYTQIELPIFNKVPETERCLVHQLIKYNFNTPLTSSCGRLFDGVAALTGIGWQANYEGQPAIEFEQLIEEGDAQPYQLTIDSTTTPFRILYRPLIPQVVSDIQQDVRPNLIAWKFHQALVEVLFLAACQARALTDLERVVLSGGVFMNRFLLENLVARLRQAGFTVYTHHQIPCNDGGIAIGQAVIADAKLKSRG